MALGLVLGLASAIMALPPATTTPADSAPIWCVTRPGAGPAIGSCRAGFVAYSEVPPDSGNPTASETTGPAGTDAPAPTAVATADASPAEPGLPPTSTPIRAATPTPATATPTTAPVSPQARRTATVPGPGALNVLNLGARGDGRTDDTAALQGILDRAAPGAVVYFPDVSPGHYRLSQTLHIRRPVTLLGAPGPAGPAGSELRQTTSGRNGLEIHASGVTVERLRLTGPGYSTFANDSAIFLDATDERRLTDLNVFDNQIQDWSNSAVRWSYVNDFLIDGNRITRCTYAGVLMISGLRGRISNNSIQDIGDPTSGSPLTNAYSISVTSEANAPYSDEVIVDHNTVTKNPIWSGIMNHGGTRILIDSNVVRDASVAYANTWVPNSPQGSDDTLFINNFASGAPRNSLWLTGADDRPTRRARAIGNRFEASASIVAYNQERAVIAWNRTSGTTGANGALRTRLTNRLLTVAGNDWGGASVTGDGTVLTYAPDGPAPPPPSGLAASRTGSQVAIRWAYGRAPNHDSFLIEHRPPGGTWEPLAFRPPNDGTWTFDAPTNAAWTRLDPLLYAVPAKELPGRQELRIRAQQGGAVSPWSEVLTIPS